MIHKSGLGHGHHLQLPQMSTQGGSGLGSEYHLQLPQMSTQESRQECCSNLRVEGALCMATCRCAWPRVGVYGHV